MLTNIKLCPYQMNLPSFIKNSLIEGIFCIVCLSKGLSKHMRECTEEDYHEY